MWFVESPRQLVLMKAEQRQAESSQSVWSGLMYYLSSGCYQTLICGQTIVLFDMIQAAIKFSIWRDADIVSAAVEGRNVYISGI